VDVPPRVPLIEHLVVQRVGVAAHRRVHRRQVVALHEVVAVGLPVARHQAGGAAVEAVLLQRVLGDLVGELAEPLVQRGDVGVRQTNTMPRHDSTWIRVRSISSGAGPPKVPGVDQPSLGVERPAVVAAHQVGLAPLAVPHDRAGAVRAQVVEALQRAVVAAAHEDRPAGEVLGDVVRRCCAAGARRRCAPRWSRRSATAPSRTRPGPCPPGGEGLDELHCVRIVRLRGAAAAEG
jgi:hypothetical protein